jgi:chromosome segregation ATPase
MKDGIRLILSACLIFIVSIFWFKPDAFSEQAAGKEANIAELESQIKQLRNLIQGFKQSDSSTQKKYSQEESFTQELQRQLKAVMAQNDILTKEWSQAKAGLELIQPIRNRLTQIETALVNLDFSPGNERELRKELATISAEMDSVDRQMSHLLKENRVYKTQAESLAGDLDAKQKEVSTLEKAVKAERIRSQGIQRNITILSEQLKMTGKEKSFFAQRSGSLEKAVEDLKKSNDSLTKRVNILSEELKTANKEKSLVEEKLIKERNSYKVQADSLSGILDTKEKELAALNKRFKEEEVKSGNLEKELGNLSGQLKSANKEKSSLTQKSESLEKLAEDLKKGNISLQGESNILSAQLKMASREKSFFEEKSESLGKIALDLKSNNASFQRELASLSEQLKNANKAKSTLEEKADDLEKITESLKKENASLKEESKRLEESLAGARGQYSGWSKEREEVLREKQEAMKNVIAQQEKIDLLAQQNTSLEKELRLLKANLEQINKDYTVLKDEHKNMAETFKQSEAELGKRADKILTLQEKLSAAQDKLDAIQFRSKEIEKDSATLRQQYVTLQMERERMRDELEETRRRLGELENRFQQIGNIFKTSEQSETAAKQEEGQSKKVNVEIIPETSASGQIGQQ